MAGAPRRWYQLAAGRSSSGPWFRGLLTTGFTATTSIPRTGRESSSGSSRSLGVAGSLLLRLVHFDPAAEAGPEPGRHPRDAQVLARLVEVLRRKWHGHVGGQFAGRRRVAGRRLRPGGTRPRPSGARHRGNPRVFDR